MSDTIWPFPASFSEANNKLRMKFRELDDDTIKDGLQYARIEFWTKHINEHIHNESEALGWLLSVAHRYLYKEIKRLNRQCPLSWATNISSGVDIERQYIYGDLLNSLENEIFQKKTSTVFMHAMGYSLQEIADSENISLSAMKQRHAREHSSLRKKQEDLFP
ncbi:MAG: RNA polymerase sigma factor [Candidatus Kapaibacterium sp.]